MNLAFDITLVEGYKNNSQKARILTENWVKKNAFCPICGREKLCKF